MWLKANASVLGDFEQLMLLGVLRLEREDGSHGAAIRQEIHGCGGVGRGMSGSPATMMS